MRREEGGETCSATERDLDEETGTTTTTTTTTSAPVPSPTKDDIEVALVVFPILVAGEPHHPSVFVNQTYDCQFFYYSCFWLESDSHFGGFVIAERKGQKQ